MKGTQRNRQFRVSEIFRVLSYLLFLLCLFAAAFLAQHNAEYIRGYQVLLYGVLGLLWFSVNWPWLGNLALFAAWVSLATRSNITATVFSAAAIVAAARVLLVPELASYESGTVEIEHFGPGYWLWSASMVCALLAALIRLSMPKPGFYEEED